MIVLIYSLTPSTEDYLEIILDLSKQNQNVRVTDIANKLKVTKASVTQALKTLQELGLIKQEKYRPIQLTEKGLTEARKVKYKHVILSRFLINVLHVEPSIAEKDACLMEHVVSPETILSIISYLEVNNTELLNDLSLLNIKKSLKK